MERFGSEQQDLQDFWATVDERVDQRVALLLSRYDQDMRPKGQTSIWLAFPQPADVPADGGALCVMGAKIHFPVTLEELHVMVDHSTHSTFELHVRLPAVSLNDALHGPEGHLGDIILTFDARSPGLTDYRFALKDLVGQGHIPTAASFLRNDVSETAVLQSVRLPAGSQLMIVMTTTDAKATQFEFNFGCRST